MPRVIQSGANDALELEGLVDLLETEEFDPRDEDNFAAFGDALKRLGNNRTFLADQMIAELKDRCTEQLKDSQYSAQVMMLHVSRKGYMIRANFWPAMQDTVVRQTGLDPFFYNVPHDHNFSFLTVGYSGPGYWSDYYEYDYENVVGFPGEKVESLKFIERTHLEEGKVMLYRAHKDIHTQLPADSLSVSLNIVEIGQWANFRDQYRFDLQAGCIQGIINRISLEPMLMIAAYQGGEADELLKDFGARHPSDRIRWLAYRARAGATRTLPERLTVLEEATASSSRLVREMARQAIDAIQHDRGWIEAEQAAFAA